MIVRVYVPSPKLVPLANALGPSFEGRNAVQFAADDDLQRRVNLIQQQAIYLHGRGCEREPSVRSITVSRKVCRA